MSAFASPPRTRAPYPRVGELLQQWVMAFDTKSNHRDVDRLAREGDNNWQLLESMFRERLLEPMSSWGGETMSRKVGDFLTVFSDDYRSLVRSVSLAGLPRNLANQILADIIFIPAIKNLLISCQEDWGGPDLEELVDPANNPFAVVLEWGAKQAGSLDSSLATLAYGGDEDADKFGREKLSRWCKGQQLPDLVSLRLFVQELQDARSDLGDHWQNLLRWLWLTRACLYLAEHTGNVTPYREALAQQWQSQRPMKSPENRLRHIAARARKLCPGFELLRNLGETLLHPARPKSPQDLTKVQEILVKYAQSPSDWDPAGLVHYRYCWMLGRFYLLQGEYEKAVPIYLSAVEEALFRAGTDQATLLQEAMTIIACFGSLPQLKHLKEAQISLGLVATPMPEDIGVVAPWEVDRLTRQFSQEFPPSGRFPGVAAIPTKHPIGELCLSSDEKPYLKPVLSVPDREKTIHDQHGNKYKKPQLIWCSTFGQADDVKALLAAGASVDALDKNGASALLCALQRADDLNDRSVLDVLLEVSHQPATLNRPTNKKHLTPLLLAIELGDPAIVAKLLEMKAAPNQRGNVISQTPLYLCIEKFSCLLPPERTTQNLRNAENEPHSAEISRRYGSSFALPPELLKTPRAQAIKAELTTLLLNQAKSRYTETSLMAIVNLLLQSGARPNDRTPTLGRTPLHLAAELDAVTAFELMLAKGGDPALCDNDGNDCRIIATGFKSPNVLSLLDRLSDVCDAN